MTLHIVNKSPHATNALASCLRVIQPGESLLFIEDGVYAALATAEAGAAIVAAPDRVQFYALQTDVAARGLVNRLNVAVNVIDYAGFVELTETHQPIQSWY